MTVDTLTMTGNVVAVQYSDIPLSCVQMLRLINVKVVCRVLRRIRLKREVIGNSLSLSLSSLLGKLKIIDK